MDTELARTVTTIAIVTRITTPQVAPSSATRHLVHWARMATQAVTTTEIVFAIRGIWVPPARFSVPPPSATTTDIAFPMALAVVTRITEESSVLPTVPQEEAL